MNHHRPHPLTIAAAGGTLAVGLVSLIARAFHTFTAFTLAPPFDWICYITAVVGILGGGSWNCWLIVRNYKHQVIALKTENSELRADRKRLDTLIQAVKDADAQGERNYVRLGKAIKMLEAQRDSANTQELPRPGLRSINGGGSA